MKFLAASRLVVPTAFCVACVSALGACSASTSAPTDSEAFKSDPSFSGATGSQIPVTVVDDVPFVPVTIDGVATQLTLDTGSPLLAVPNHDAATLASSSPLLVALGVGPLAFPQAPSAVLDIDGDSPDTDGLLGGSVLRAFAVGIDYQNGALTLNPAPLTGGASTPFQLLGGGPGVVYNVDADLPATRIVVDTIIEGSSHKLVLDTGASSLLLTQALFSSLVADGRPVQAGTAATQYGPVATSSATLRSVTVAGLEVTTANALAGGGGDDRIDSLATETGLRIEGLLGGSYLKNFSVVIDYPNESLTLVPNAAQ